MGGVFIPCVKGYSSSNHLNSVSKGKIRTQDGQLSDIFLKPSFALHKRRPVLFTMEWDNMGKTKTLADWNEVKVLIII